MKNVLFIFGCLIVVVFFSCKKSSNQASEKMPLIGKWTLTEILGDPGDGSGKWTTVDKQNYYYLQFKTDGTIESNMDELEKYKIINDSVIHLIYVSGVTINRYYKLENSSLTLTGGCIEACGSKFIKVMQ